MSCREVFVAESEDNRSASLGSSMFYWARYTERPVWQAESDADSNRSPR